MSSIQTRRISRKYFVYAYYRKKEDFPQRPFYVGKGTGNRHLDHLKDTSDGPKARCIRKHHDTLYIRKLLSGVDEETAYRTEIILIEHFGRVDLGTGVLYNQTSGGDGFVGTLRSEEHRRKIGEANHRRAKPKIKAPRKPRTSDHNRKISEALSGRVRSEDHNRRLSEGAKRRYAEKDNPLKGRSRPEISESVRQSWKTRSKSTCHHCGGLFHTTPYVRFHGDQCKMNPNRKP